MSGDTVPHDVHVDLLVSCFSMTYPVSGDPPSDLGDFHLILMDDLLVAVTSRSLGVSGLSKGRSGCIRNF